MTFRTSRIVVAVSVVASLFTLGCGQSSPEAGDEASTLVCEVSDGGPCPQGPQPGTTTFNAPPRVHRLQPACESVAILPGTSVRFAIGGEFLPELDGNGDPLTRADIARVDWYIDDSSTWFNLGAGPFVYTRAFTSVGSHVITARLSDATQNRLADVDWTITVTNDPAAAGALGGSPTDPTVPYYCFGAPDQSDISVVRGETRRVYIHGIQGSDQVARTTWYWNGAYLGEQTFTQLPNSHTHGSTFFFDLQQSALGNGTLRTGFFSWGASAAFVNRTVTVRERGRSVNVEGVAGLLMGDDPDAQISTLLSFVDNHGINAVVLHGVDDILDSGRCLSDPGALGCMPLATLVAGLHQPGREVEVAVVVDSKADLDAILAFEVANPGYFDVLYTRCAFWDPASACFGGTFDDADDTTVDSYMELLREMDESGITVGAYVATTEVEELEAVRDVVDRIYLDVSSPGERYCHYKQVEDTLEAVSRTPQNPVEVYPVFADEFQVASACAQGDDYAAFEEWEEDFYGRLRGEGLKDCAWTGERPNWLDGVRVTGFQFRDYATLAGSLDDADCDGVDDDCDGTADEGYPVESVTCGEGGCQNTGSRYCQAGGVMETCTPLPALPDDNCDGVDDDCDGSPDDDYVSVPVCDYAYAPILCGNTTCTDGVLGDDIIRPACNLAECPVSNECMTATCVDFACAEEPLPDGTACGEMGADLCVAGSCVLPGCGNGYREAYEGCDDGNNVDGDACSSTCSSLIQVIDVSADGSYEPIPPERSDGLVADGSGALVAVWIRDYFDHEELHVRRYNRGGADLDAGATTLLDGALFRPSNAHPVVAGLADGGWVVAWSALRQGERNIVYRIVAPDGSLGFERLANEQRLGTQWKPVITESGDGFILAWVDTWDTATDRFNGVVARRFDGAGVPLGPEMALAADRTDWEEDVQVAGTWSSDDWIAAWTQGFDARTYVRRFSGDAAVDTAEHAVVNYHAAYPSVAALSDGRYLVAFESWSPMAAIPVLAQVVEAAGTPFVDSLYVSTEPNTEFWSRPASFAWENGEWGFLTESDPGDGPRTGGALSPVFTLSSWDLFYLSSHVFSEGSGSCVFTKVPDGLWVTWLEPADDPDQVGRQWSAAYARGLTP